MRRFIVVLAALLVAILLSPRALAQSNVLSQDERALYAQMDPALLGYWEGHVGDNDGMKYDPQAIACMVNKCSLVRQRNPQDSKQLRDSANFGSCYDAHLARIKKPGYTRLTNPPPIYVLGCNLIAAQANSVDDRVYAAVNGHSRNRPKSSQVVVRVARRGVTPTDAERAFLLAQITKTLASASGRLVDDNPYKDEKPTPKPRVQSKSNVVRSPAVLAAKPKVANDNTYIDTPAPVAAQPAKARASGGSSVVKQYGDLGDKLVLLSSDGKQAKVYVREGGQFYRIRASFLAEKYDVDWKNVFLANQYADTIGACWNGNKVVLDSERMKAKSYDKTKLEGPVNMQFLEDCKGEFNFALQAGQTIVLTAKDSSPPVQAPVQEPSPQQPEKQAQDQASVPEPTANTVPADEVPVAAAPEVPDAFTAAPTESVMVSPVQSASIPSGETPPANSVSAINVVANGEPRDGESFLGEYWLLLLTSTAALVLFCMGILRHLARSRKAALPPAPPPSAPTLRWGAESGEPTVRLDFKPRDGPPTAKN